MTDDFVAGRGFGKTVSILKDLERREAERILFFAACRWAKGYMRVTGSFKNTENCVCAGCSLVKAVINHPDWEGVKDVVKDTGNIDQP